MSDNTPKMTDDPFADMSLTGWYPGHMLKATRQMQEVAGMVDLVVEMVDARAPNLSRNPEIRQLLPNKPFLMVANKADLADPASSRRWEKWFREQGEEAMFLDARRLAQVRQLPGFWKQQIDQARAARGATRPQFRPARVMIVGVPNIGKSTLVNHLRRRKQAQVGPKPGVTRQHQWLTLEENMELLDTPGLLWPRIQDKKHELLLALLGIMKEELLDSSLIAEYFCWETKRQIENMDVKWQEMGLATMPDNGHQALQKMAEQRGLKQAGGTLDLERAANALLKDFRQAKLGRMTWEQPPITIN